MDTLIKMIDVLLMTIWVLYILVSLVRRRWNNFLYAICIVLLILSHIPTIPFFVLLISIVILHNYIAKKEKEELKKQTEEETNKQE